MMAADTEPESRRIAAEPSDTAHAIHVRGAGLDYGGVALFDALDVDVEAGRTTCLLGPSGVGKTSLLRLIAGLGPTGTRGRVWYGDDQSAAGRIAYMAQSDLLMPWLTVFDNVVLGARLRGEQPDRQRALALLTQVGLVDRRRDRPDSLSGGMRQRAALARTLMDDRPIVLMDEPFSALDAITRSRLQELAVTLLRGRTVLLVTHDPLEALRVGDLVRVMAGRPARLDEPLQLPGPPPRDPRSARIMSLYGELLERLSSADQGR